MNIFGVGGAELVLIIVIMLVVAGPKRMVRWAYVAGEYIGRLRHMWSEVVDVVQREIDDAGLDVKLPSDPPTRQNLDEWVRSAAKPFTDELESTAKEIEATTKEATSAVKKVQITAREAVAPSTAMSRSGGGTNPKSGAKPEEKAPDAQKTQTQSLPDQETSFGTWGGAAQSPDESKQNDSSFGAWGTPRKSEQQDNGTGVSS